MSIENDVEDVVQSAIAANWSPTKLIEMLRQTWAAVLADKGAADDREFQKALK
jgi:hypothetical protein